MTVSTSATRSADDSDHQSEVARPSDSRRDPEVLRAALQRWLATQLPADTAPEVTHVHLPDANGMSSETILFDATWSGEVHPLVARVAPADTTMPVFPDYDLDGQFQAMTQVREHSAVPVPVVYWSEPDPGPLGAPFFVMARVSGQVPPDVMPYNFGSWVTEATEEQRAVLQHSAVNVLAQLHDIDRPWERFAFLRLPGAGPTVTEALAAHIRQQRDYYEWTTRSGPRSPLIERGFAWMEENLPDDTSPAVFCWGDARIGNMMFEDFRPVAVLDWEMATLGPRELDLGWMTYLHRFFEDIAAAAGLDGMPDFLRLDDLAALYEELTGHTPRDLEYYTTYAALRQATIMLRIQERAIHFGQAAAPEDPDDLIMHRASLEAMLDGTYWEKIR
ncbi:phosphotransferase family protein [Rhodococcus opacus]|uniref:phosphotransferase family protein n=1 Tax=Rhodococcus opacus TaxID=37919 RepID=UPI001C449C9D|nr:phosphotransferase family protein [Rhodococcus opacus]MBV6759310.1 phosphotransferase family protein [Rhodococcus opacus]